MHPQIVDAIVNSVRARIDQGDCPTEPAQTIEALENCVADMADEIERLRCALTDIAELRDRDPLDVGFVHTPLRLKEVQARLEEARSIARAALAAVADLRAIVQRYRDSHDDITRDHAEIDRLTAALVAARDHLLSGGIGGVDAALADIITALGPN